MATGTFYLRPSVDVSLGHPVYPETLTAGYLAINEEVSDGASTYIGVASPSSDSEYTSTFKLSIDDISEVTNILSAKFKFSGAIDGDYQEGNSCFSICECTITIDGADVFVGGKKEGYFDDNDDTLTDADIPNLVPLLNTYINNYSFEAIPDITVKIHTSYHHGSAKGTVNCYVSQIAIELECEYTYATGFNIYHKANGAWKQAQTAYQKQNGAWVEITEDTCKEILQSGFIVRGD